MAALTRSQLIQKWSKNAKQYEELGNKAELGDFDDEPIDRSVHYQVIADLLNLHATELSHASE